MPGAVTSMPRGRVVLVATVGAAMSFWICFAIVASARRSSPRPTAAAQPVLHVPAVSLALHALPDLRVRAVLLRHAPRSKHHAPRHARHVKHVRHHHRRRAAAAAARSAPVQAPAPARSAPVEPAHGPAPTDITSAPAPRPVARARPRPTAAPKRPSRPGFDQSRPTGFDNAG
jgi:hypothetical protein